MRRFPTGHTIAAIAIAMGLLFRCHSVAAASSAPAPVADAVNPLLNPPLSDGSRLSVAIAMRVINISDIDEVSQRFKMVGYLLAHWKDPRLAFTPRTPSEKFRTYSPGQIWYPRLDFVNGVTPLRPDALAERVRPAYMGVALRTI